jgi:hypothetical protein
LTSCTGWLLDVSIDNDQAILSKNEIDTLNSLPVDGKVTALYKIKNEISDAYSKDIIDETHYSLLKEKLQTNGKI